MTRLFRKLFPLGICLHGVAALSLLVSARAEARVPTGFSVAAILGAERGDPVADCNGNEIPDDEELSTNDCNSNGIPDECDLGIALKSFLIPDNRAIPDNNPAGVTSAVNINDAGIIADLDLGLVITHTWNGDLIVRLSHLGTTVTVIDRPGRFDSGFGFNNDGFDITLDDAAPSPIETANSGGPAVVGRFSPNEALAAFNGMQKLGEWELFISDNAAGDTGMLVQWTLDFANADGESASQDCNGNRHPDECDLCGDPMRGECSQDCNDNGIPDECEEDCNENGIPDECDIADQDSMDCQPDGIPDECQLKDNDCNQNEIPDDCEPDCNNNGLADDCDVNGVEATFYEDLWPLENDTQGPPARGVGPGGNVADDLHFAGPGMMTGFTFGYVNTTSDNVTTTIEFYTNNPTADPNSDFNFIAGFEFNLPPSGPTTVFHDSFAPVSLPQDVWMAFRTPVPTVRGFTARPLISTSMPTAGTSLDLLYDFNSDTLFDFGGDPLANLVLAVYGISEPTSEDCQPNGIPDDCEEDCNGNNIPDECELCPDHRARGCTEDCNSNGIPDECEDLEDCNDNGVPDVCELFKDCNGNDIPDECEDLPDCNENGLPDVCDLCREEEALRGNDCSEDCNGNDVPDECDPDCNENGVPDDCEEFEDCNANGIPDECDGGCPPEQEQPMDDFMTDFKTDTGQPTPCGDCGKMDPLWFLLGLGGYAGLMFVRRRAR